MAIKADDLIKAYVNIREKRAEVKSTFDDADKSLKEKQEKIERALLGMCKESGVESFKTSFGTASRVVTERYWAPDKDAMANFIKEHDCLELLEGRLHQGNLKQFIADHPDVRPPVDIDAKYTIRVRKPTK